MIKRLRIARNGKKKRLQKNTCHPSMPCLASYQAFWTIRIIGDWNQYSGGPNHYNLGTIRSLMLCGAAALGHMWWVSTVWQADTSGFMPGFECYCGSEYESQKRGERMPILGSFSENTRCLDEIPMQCEMEPGLYFQAVPVQPFPKIYCSYCPDCCKQLFELLEELEEHKWTWAEYLWSQASRQFIGSNDKHQFQSGLPIASKESIWN